MGFKRPLSWLSEVERTTSRALFSPGLRIRERYEAMAAEPQAGVKAEPAASIAEAFANPITSRWRCLAFAILGGICYSFYEVAALEGML